MIHKGPSIVGPLQAQSIYLPMSEMPIGWDTAVVLAVPSVTGVGTKDRTGKRERSKRHSRGGRGYVLSGPLTPCEPYSYSSSVRSASVQS